LRFLEKDASFRACARKVGDAVLEAVVLTDTCMREIFQVRTPSPQIPGGFRSLPVPISRFFEWGITANPFLGE
jgi:hypothetical protein